MPSTYAHYRMGRQVQKEIEGEERRIIEEYYELYLIGLHGPDILFYYHPLVSNHTNRIGYATHEYSGKAFFTRAAEVIRRRRADVRGSAPYLAYAYGVLNHFALDVSCHAYIDNKIAESGISHTEIEVEFDRELMVLDGRDPITSNLTKHIHPTRENGNVISEFYPGTTGKQIQTALKMMIAYNNLLIAPSKLKRSLIYGLLKLTGNYTEMHGLIVNYEKNPACADSTEKLKALYALGRKRAIKFIKEFGGCLEDTSKYEQIFNFTFGGKPELDARCAASAVHE